jgi:hypothetical protein
MFTKDYQPPLYYDPSASTNATTYCQGSDDNAVCGGDAVGSITLPDGPASLSWNSDTSRHRRTQTMDVGDNTKGEFTNKIRQKIKYEKLHV